ncbi:hypothetical protein [Paenibacillus elgii]|uniref:hypothetical protein n=1 Tax=Paenibacillus elgii TaxID=189691 RepID=UPI000FD63D02|nr:hypothetical protein [Paenibacillus elgii]NEN84082.1 hypothetical protein [Paenibacillus elgii]
MTKTYSSEIWTELLEYIYLKLTNLELSNNTVNRLKAITNTYVVEDIDKDNKKDKKGQKDQKDLGTTSLRERTPREKFELALFFLRSRLLEAPSVAKEISANLQISPQNIKFISDITSTEPDLSDINFSLDKINIRAEELQSLIFEFDKLYNSLSTLTE